MDTATLTPPLPTLYQQLQLLCGILVSAGQKDGRVFKAEVVEYHLCVVQTRTPDVLGMAEYPNGLAKCSTPDVCECGRVSNTHGNGYIHATCFLCRTHNPRRWYYMAERIAFQSQGKVHRRWAEIMLARAIAAHYNEKIGAVL
jgi:hypothetical protein